MSRLAERMRSTSFRTFVLCPVIVVGWELLLHDGWLRVEPLFLPLLAWGFLQYRIVGRYRMQRGGGGPGMDTPPERLVTTGPFAFCRNPMYLGHMIFLFGLTLSLHSALSALITAATIAWFQFRVRRDETRLSERFGQTYVDYAARVSRWIPGLTPKGLE
jgi:protein-S-isoprenylcysteine O-methyltransferase Ste14